MVQDKEYEQQVRQWVGKMLGNRKGRRRLAKKDGRIKDWADIQDAYGPINKPIDLGINKFKKMAREKLANPYQYVLNYKTEMWKAFDKIVDSTENL